MDCWAEEYIELVPPNLEFLPSKSFSSLFYDLAVLELAESSLDWDLELALLVIPVISRALCFTFLILASSSIS